MSEEKNTQQLGIENAPPALETLTHPEPRHPWTPGPVISQPDSAIKALPTGIVRALPTSENGRALLELRNESDARIRVDSALWMKGGHGANLLAEPLLLRPGGSRRVDVTEKLSGAVQAGCGSSNGTFRFQILLVLEPEPQLQPGPASYQVVLREGHVEDFRPDRA